MTFEDLATDMLERRHVRATDVKDAVVRLAQAGTIENSWKIRGARMRKPSFNDLIFLRSQGP